MRCNGFLVFIALFSGGALADTAGQGNGTRLLAGGSGAASADGGATATLIENGATLDSAQPANVERLRLKGESDTTSEVSAYDMLDHAISVIRASALNANRVDWTVERESLLTSDLKTLSAQEGYSRIRKILTSLGDRHSFVRVPTAAAMHREKAVATQAVEARQMPDIGYLLVPGLRGTGPSASEAFRSQLCEHVARLAPTSSQGWIIDLRDNTGGNMWPMINGLSSLLGGAEVGAIRDRHGAVTPWQARYSNACSVGLSRSPVAVLVGPKTASSGEAVAIAFRARPETRFFGQPTAGLSTSNQPYALPDGGVLVLTTAVFLDRNGEAYLQGVQPEQLVPSDQDVVAAAAAWLRSLP